MLPGLYQNNIGIPCALPNNKTFVEDIKIKDFYLMNSKESILLSKFDKHRKKIYSQA